MTARPARVADWPERLAGYLAFGRRRAFSWGSHDCALFAAGWVFVATGVDPAAEFRGTYGDAAGAAVALQARGFDDVAAAAAASLPPVEVGLAWRGDVVAAMVAGGVALGVLTGDRAAFAAAPRGLAWLPRAACLQAWRV